jgi:four helix bundle protein
LCGGREIADKAQIPNAKFQTNANAWENKRVKIKMQNDKAKFKEEFKNRVYRFALDVIGFVDRLPVEQTSRIITDQLIRSTTSIGANVIEAQAASSRKDYTNFFAYALKSANECKFWLGLLRDSGRGDKETVNRLLKEATEIANVLATSILTLKGKR